MPLTFLAYEKLNDDLRDQLENLYDISPEFADGKHAVEALEKVLAMGAQAYTTSFHAKLYTAEFNDKVIAAIWVTGQGSERLLRYIVVHYANRGRGLADQLVKTVTEQERQLGIERFQPGCGAIHRALAHLGLVDSPI
jgi:GNAT superfamily N-acetyltransferase